MDSFMKLLEWQPQGHVIALVFSLRSFFSLSAYSCNLQVTEQQNQGILYIYLESSATFNINYMLLITLDSNRL
jgi:hypothetical protein